MAARCDHEKRKSAVACITEVIGEKNTKHFFVATQDAELRKKLQEIPVVPLIYGLRNALFLERPSAVQQELAKAAEEERSHMTELEFKMLKSTKKRSRADKMDKAQFKRKKAKGPNPLSCKKKKKQGDTDTASEKMRSQIRPHEGDSYNSPISRSRKRKRSEKSKSSTEQTVQ